MEQQTISPSGNSLFITQDEAVLILQLLGGVTFTGKRAEIRAALATADSLESKVRPIVAEGQNEPANP